TASRADRQPEGPRLGRLDHRRRRGPVLRRQLGAAGLLPRPAAAARDDQRRRQAYGLTIGGGAALPLGRYNAPSSAAFAAAHSRKRVPGWGKIRAVERARDWRCFRQRVWIHRSPRNARADRAYLRGSKWGGGLRTPPRPREAKSMAFTIN